MLCACLPQACCVQHLVTLFLQKEEELHSVQAELHGVLAGVTAARHEQQEEQRKIAHLKHQHEDTLQVPLLHFPSCSASSSLFHSFAFMRLFKLSRDWHSEHGTLQWLPP